MKTQETQQTACTACNMMLHKLDEIYANLYDERYDFTKVPVYNQELPIIEPKITQITVYDYQNIKIDFALKTLEHFRKWVIEMGYMVLTRIERKSLDNQWKETLNKLQKVLEERDE